MINISAVQSERQKNVHFSADTHSWHYEVPSERDATFGATDTSDMIQDFMSRPVLALQAQIPIGQDFNAFFNPWKAFFENPRVLEKLRFFRNLRCDLKIKLVVNGNPFYYGSFLMSYQPLHFVDSRISEFRGSQSLIQFSQMPHVYIDPCEGTGGEITVPYFFPKDAMNIIEADWNEMGLIDIKTIFPLQHANDNTEPIDISVFVMAENVQLSTPTSRIPMENQADEYGKPSMIAHSIARAAGWFADYPVIGRYARATQMITSSMGDMASLFGYSRPREVLESSSVRQRPAGNLAVTNLPDNIGSLALDAKKEVTIDPRVVGLPSTDEMAISPIAQRESYVTVFPWAENAAPDSHLFSIRVNPIQGDVASGVNHYLTPSAFTSLPFRYWRGSMRFRFNIVASKYHRGRLKFVWDPDYNAGSSGVDYNSNYITIVDLNQQKDVVMDIGWGSNYSYLETGGLILPKFSTEAFTSPSRWSNGTLSVFVVNSLTSPGPTNSDVGVAVYSSMLHDYEVACPDSVFIDGEIVVRDTPLPPMPPSNPIDGDDGGMPQPPPVPTDPTIPEEPEGDTPVEIIIPDGIGFGNRMLWPTHPMGKGLTIDRVTDQASIPGAGGSTFMVPSFVGLLEVTIFSTEAETLKIEHLAEDGTTVIEESNVLMNAGVNTSMTVFGTDDENLQTKYNFIRISGTNEQNDIRIVDLAINGVSFIKYTAEQMNARLASGPLTFDANGKATFTFANLADKLLLDVPPGLTFEDNGPIIHYMLTGNVGAVHRYNGINRASGADSANKFSVGEELVYDSPGVMALQGANTAIPSLGPMTIEGAILMYYPSVENQAMENQADENETMDEAAAPVALSSNDTMAPYLPGMETNAVYFGEQVTSWRQVLKRYETITTFGQASSAPSPDLTSFNIRWHDSFTELANSFSLDTRRLSMIDYVKSAYVGVRGGMRLKLLPISNPSGAGTVVISNVRDATRGANVLELPSWSGSVFEPIAITGAADAEIPYYSNLRFFPARLSGAEYSAALGRNPRAGIQRLEANITIHGSSIDATYALAQATAEDFSLHFFLCTPVLSYGTPRVTNPQFG